MTHEEFVAAFDKLFPRKPAPIELTPLQSLRRAFLLINTDMSHTDATAEAKAQ